MILSTFLENLGNYSKSRNSQLRVLELLHGTAVIMQEREIYEKGNAWQMQQVGLLCHINRKGQSSSYHLVNS